MDIFCNIKDTWIYHSHFKIKMSLSIKKNHTSFKETKMCQYWYSPQIENQEKNNLPCFLGVFGMLLHSSLVGLSSLLQEKLNTLNFLSQRGVALATTRCLRFGAKIFSPFILYCSALCPCATVKSRLLYFRLVSTTLKFQKCKKFVLNILYYKFKALIKFVCANMVLYIALKDQYIFVTLLN